MKTITLSNGQLTLVSDVDFDYLAQYKWYYSGIGYAYRVINLFVITNNHLYMHHEILLRMGLKLGNKVTDHIDRNPYNNQRSNLRIVTISENAFNSKLRIDSTSGYKGISWYSNRGKWVAYIWKNKEKIFLGYFDKLEDAIAARLNAEKRLYKNLFPKENL